MQAQRLWPCGILNQPVAVVCPPFLHRILSLTAAPVLFPKGSNGRSDSVAFGTSTAMLVVVQAAVEPTIPQSVALACQVPAGKLRLAATPSSMVFKKKKIRNLKITLTARGFALDFVKTIF